MRARSGAGALALALLSAASFGSSGPFAKSLVGSGWSPLAVVGVRVAGAALLLLVPAVLVARRARVDWRRAWRPVVGYGVLGVATCQLAFFVAVTHLTIGVALLLEYLAPVLVVGWLWARHAHRPTRLTVAGVTLAVAGLGCVVDPTGGSGVSAVGIGWGLLAAVGLTGYFLLAGSSEALLPPTVLAAGGLAVGALVLVAAGASGLFPLAAATAPARLGGAEVPWWLALTELAVVSAALAYVTGVLAVRALGSRVASFVGLTEVLFAVVFAWLLLGELPGPVQLAGGVLIVAGVAAIRADERASAPTAREGASAAGDGDFPLPARVD